MFPFAGFGNGLAGIAIHVVFFSMGMALPVFLVVVAISRRALAWTYCVLYVITSGGIYMLHAANSSDTPLHRLSGKNVFEAMFSSVAILYFFLIFMTGLIVRAEHRKGKIEGGRRVAQV
jgi:hypothetical protein